MIEISRSHCYIFIILTCRFIFSYKNGFKKTQKIHPSVRIILSKILLHKTKKRKTISLQKNLERLFLSKNNTILLPQSPVTYSPSVGSILHYLLILPNSIILTIKHKNRQQFSACHRISSLFHPLFAPYFILR